MLLRDFLWSPGRMIQFSIHRFRRVSFSRTKQILFECRVVNWTTLFQRDRLPQNIASVSIWFLLIGRSLFLTLRILINKSFHFAETEISMTLWFEVLFFTSSINSTQPCSKVFYSTLSDLEFCFVNKIQIILLFILKVVISRTKINVSMKRFFFERKFGFILNEDFHWSKLSDCFRFFK